MSKTPALIPSGLPNTALLPPSYTIAVISVNPRTGKSSLCKRLVDPSVDHYRTFSLKTKSTHHPQVANWFYWGFVKHRRADEKREAIFHLIEQSSLAIDENEHYDNYLKRITAVSLRAEGKVQNHSDYPQVKTFPKDKVNIDGFLCLHDLSTGRDVLDLLFVLHSLFKTRRPVLIVTTKNDLLENQIESAAQFEELLRRSSSNDAAILAGIPIIHTSSVEQVNIHSILELALYVFDDPSSGSSRKHSNAGAVSIRYFPPPYEDARRSEQSLKNLAQIEYRTLLMRHVTDVRSASWSQFYDHWQHHGTVQTFLNFFGKQQTERIYNEHIEELNRKIRQNLIEQRLIPIVEMLITDPKIKMSRNWDYVRLQMQNHADYSKTVIPSSKWSDSKENETMDLVICEDLLNTTEARLCFESYINSRQIEQTRRTNCRSFFDLLNRFSDAGLVHYGHSYEKDSVYFMGRECHESLCAQDRLRVFAFHQSYLYRLLCLKFVELLFESFGIFLETFQKMNLATTPECEYDRKLSTVTIDEIFEKEIIQQIKHDPRYQTLNDRERDRHRLIMCHCHFLYDCIYYPPIRNYNRLLKQRKRSFRRQKSSSQALFGVNMNIEENFCPYTRKISSPTDEKDGQIKKKKFEIGCPMEENCADVRIMNQLFTRRPSQKQIKKNILICGNDNDVDQCLQIFSKKPSLIDEYQINIWTLNNIKSQILDGCLIVSSNGRHMLEELLAQKKLQFNLDNIPIANFTIPSNESSIDDAPIETQIEQILLHEEMLFDRKRFDLRILLCFMCGSDLDDVDLFFSHLSSRFSLTVTKQSGETSFVINAVFNRTNQKIEFIPVAFHSLFAMKLNEFDGFILFFDRERKAAANTMTYLEKYISSTLENQINKKSNGSEKHNETVTTRPPIYLLACIKDLSLSGIKPFTNFNLSVQCHNGSIRSFIESHLLLFLNQCVNVKNSQRIFHQNYQNEELLAGVTSYFNRAMHCSTSDLMSSSFERVRKPLVNSFRTERVTSLTYLSKSNEHSPRYHLSSLTPTNASTYDQIFSNRSYPHLSLSNHGASSTIVPTTPVDPSVTNLGLLSAPLTSTASSNESQQPFKKSTSMRFAKLMEHPTNGSSYQSSVDKTNNENSLTTHRPLSEHRSRLSSDENMKFYLYKHRNDAHVKVPLATPEIIEFNESIATPFSVKQNNHGAFVSANHKTDETFAINSSSSSPPTTHQHHGTHSQTTRDESITDSSKQTRDSSIDSSSDEHLKDQQTSTVGAHNPTVSLHQQSTTPVVTLQRKVSDRKSKRVRAKLNETTGSASSSEVLKKTGSDDELLADDDKRPQQQPYQRKKRRPSFKRRKKVIYDQAQTDSGIDSRMDSKDNGKGNVTNEPSSSSNVVISNEDDSSVGDYTKDSKNTSIEELEERPTANWIRRQLQHFAQARRDKNELKTRSPASTTTVTSISSPPLPSFKATMVATSPNTHTNVSPLSSLENSHQHIPLRLTLSRCALSKSSGVPLFIEKCIQFIEQYGLAIEGLYRVSGYKNQVELVINKLIEDPNYDLNLLQIPASAVATALKDMMRKLDEPLLSLELFDECQNLTIDQLRAQNFIPLRKALSRPSELKQQTIKYLFRHLHFVSQHAASTHMDSSNLAVLWWPNLFQPHFRDFRTAEQTCQRAKPLIQAIIDNYPAIFSNDSAKSH